MTNSWKVTERYNILLSMGVLLLFLLILSYFKQSVFVASIVIGVWIFIFYKWEILKIDEVGLK